MSRPVKVTDFADHVAQMKADSARKYAEEYNDLKEVGREQTVRHAELAANRSKNRFMSILPYDHSRVKLLPLEGTDHGEEGADYINASYMQGFSSEQEYIAAQGPLQSTVEDFWRLVWQQKAQAIVMLTNCMEKEKEKCAHYWPTNSVPVHYGNLQVSVVNVNKTTEWETSEFRLKKGGQSWNIHHFHFLGWPDFRVPDQPQSLLKFVRHVRSKLSTSAGPVVVHCSAGVGRSGTFIVLDRLLQHIKKHDYVDIYGVVHSMRMNRVHMVQKRQQYIYIHDCILHEIENLKVTNTNKDTNKDTKQEDTVTTTGQAVSVSTQKFPKELWTQGVEVKALYSFNGSMKEDLKFTRGDILTIRKKTRDPMWFLAENKKGDQGMIPANYVEKAEPVPTTDSWYHGDLSRKQSEDLLHTRENGLFLVRDSANFPGDYTLSLCFDRNIEHYRINSKDKRLTIDEESYFDNLRQLVEHYRIDSDGLVSSLKQHIPAARFISRLDEDLIIKKGNIYLKNLISKGDYANNAGGDVYKAIYRFGKKVGVRTRKEDDEGFGQTFLAEVSFLKLLKHPNIVELIGVVLDDKKLPFYIVTELLEKGSLLDYIQPSHPKEPLTKLGQLNFAREICAGLAYLEVKHILLTAVRARNILLADNKTAKIADLTAARYAPDETLKLEPNEKIPVKWTAPEFFSKTTLCKKSVVWSFGVVLWEIYSFGRNLYPGVQNMKYVEQVQSDKWRKQYMLKTPEGCPTKIYDLMCATWEQEPNKRPSFGEILKKLESIKA